MQHPRETSLFLTVSFFSIFSSGHTENFKQPFANTTTSVGDMGFAFYGSLWAYDSWNNLNFLTDEIQNPFRTLPLAIMIGIPSVTFCYVMMNVAYSVFLTNQQIAATNAVAVVSMKPSPDAILQEPSNIGRSSMFLMVCRCVLYFVLDEYKEYVNR